MDLERVVALLYCSLVSRNSIGVLPCSILYLCCTCVVRTNGHTFRFSFRRYRAMAIAKSRCENEGLLWGVWGWTNAGIDFSFWWDL